MAKLSLKITILMLLALNLFLLDTWILRRDSGKLIMILHRAQSMAINEDRPYMILLKNNRAILKATLRDESIETLRLFTLFKIDDESLKGEGGEIVFGSQGLIDPDHQPSRGREIRLKSYFGQEWSVFIERSGAIRPGEMIGR